MPQRTTEKNKMESNPWMLFGGLFAISAAICLGMIGLKNWGKSPLKVLTPFEKGWLSYPVSYFF
jgi:hypothetical protein